MNVAFASSYCLGGTGIARYQRELIDTYAAWLVRSAAADQLALVTPFNRSHRPDGLPSACAFRRSPMPGKLQRALNLGLGYPLERIVPGLLTSELIHSLDPQALATRRPWLVTIHDVAWRRFGPAYASVFNRAMQRSAERCIASADHLVAVSRSTADELVRGGVPASRISVIYQGVEGSPDPRADGGAELAAPEGGDSLRLPERYVLYIGTFHHRKNLPLIARAYALPDAAGLVPCLIAGPPPQEPLRHFGIDGDRIRYLGYLSDAVLARVLRGASALIFPSLHEGFGRPLVEAMALGIPVVASRIPAFTEVADDAALFFDVEDEAAAAVQLCDQLLRLLGHDGLARDLSDRGRQRARLFSWDRSCAELRALHAHLIPA